MPHRSSARPGVRGRSAQSTRRKLMLVGRRAFARRGLSGTSLVDDVLAPAGVSVGSFYHQFADKTDLLLAILEQGAERQEALRASLAAAVGRARAASIGRYQEALLGWARRNRELWRIGARERFAEQPRVRRLLARERQRWVDALARALAAGRGGRPGGPDPRRLAEWSMRLAWAAADEQLLPAARAGRRPAAGADDLLAFTLAGARSLGRRRPRPTRASGG